MADPEHRSHVLRHRNIFESNSGRPSGEDGDNSISDDREISDGSGGTRLDTEAGKPCKVLGCRCICQHHHFLYGTSHNPRTAFVDASHDYCPEEGHGLNDNDLRRGNPNVGTTIDPGWVERS